MTGVTNLLGIAQVDADYQLQELKKDYKELEMKERGYKKRLGDLRIDFMKHMEQYASTYSPHRIISRHYVLQADLAPLLSLSLFLSNAEFRTI